MRSRIERVAVVGATSSIGRAIATRLARDGARVVLCGRRVAELELIAKDIAIRTGSDARVVRYEALAFDEHAEFVRRAERAFPGEEPGLEGLVVVVGEMAEQTDAEADFALARRMIDVNYASVVSLCEELAPRLAANRGGFLCAIGSVAGDRGRQSNYLYGSTKAALATYVDGLRVRLAKAGVGVTLVKPGFVDTPMTWGRPGVFLAAKPSVVARDVVRGIRRNRRVVYTPWFWRWILLAVRLAPDALFRRLAL